MRTWIAACCIAVLSFSGGASAQIIRELSPLDGVGIDEKPNAPLPLEVAFRDSSGKKVRLEDLFDGNRPVLLSLNYSDCPMLCQLQLNGLVDGLRELDWNVGEQLIVCSVSIDPLETPDRARQAKQRHVRDYGRAGTASGWRFLTGDKASIDQLADAVGFQYKYVPESREYAHSAALFVCTPDGRVSRYLYGVLYPAQTLKLSLVEAGQGKIGSAIDRVILYCFHYDETSGRYAPVARRLMKVGAAATLTTLVISITPYWLRRRRVAAIASDT
ncbi:MAG: SCO family protein [Planctomycetota bacterium]